MLGARPYRYVKTNVELHAGALATTYEGDVVMAPEFKKGITKVSTVVHQLARTKKLPTLTAFPSLVISSCTTSSGLASRRIIGLFSVLSTKVLSGLP
jgi:hypothetical protein